MGSRTVARGQVARARATSEYAWCRRRSLAVQAGRCASSRELGRVDASEGESASGAGAVRGSARVCAPASERASTNAERRERRIALRERILAQRVGDTVNTEVTMQATRERGQTEECPAVAQSAIRSPDPEAPARPAVQPIRLTPDRRRPLPTSSSSTARPRSLSLAGPSL